MGRRQEIIKKIASKEVRELMKEYGLPRNRSLRMNEYHLDNEDSLERKESEILFLEGLRRKRERVNIIPLKRLTKQALMFVGGNNFSQPHEEEQYWSWVKKVQKVDKDMIFVFEGHQDKEIYTLSADSLWYMGNKSSREDMLLGTKKKEVTRNGYYGYYSIDVCRDRNFNII